MTRFLWLTLLLLTRPGLAQWTNQERQRLDLIEQKYRLIDHTGFATFWGGLKRTVRLSWNDGATAPWQTPLFKHGELPLYFSAQEHAAPLVVILPGIFGNTDKGLTPHTVDRFERMGAHVLVVPNLVSLQYIKAWPIYGSDLVESEARILEAALEEALRRLGSKVNGVHVMAESLGTVVGAAWIAWDTTHLKRVSSLTLLSPPLDLARAMVNFDEIINEYRTVLGTCSQLKLSWLTLKEVLLSETPGEIALTERRCLAAEVIVSAFLKSAQRSFAAYAEVMKSPSTPEVTSFTDFFRRYRPEMHALIEQRDDRLKLGHWVKRIRQQSALPLRILTSKDDFLNRGLSWAQFLDHTQLSSDHLFTFSWGGHSGILAPKELDEVLAAVINGSI